MVQFLPESHDAENDTGIRGRIRCRALDDGAAVAGIGKMLYGLLKGCSVFFGIAGVVLPLVILDWPRRLIKLPSNVECGLPFLVIPAIAIGSMIGLFTVAVIFEKSAALVRRVPRRPI
jgi:hypothetical protein